MDKKLFEETVRQLAEIETPEYLETVYDSELDPETGLEQVVKRDVLVRGEPVLKKLKPCQRNCDYCDKSVTDQIINIRVAQNPVPHWRYRCTACESYLDPETLKPMPEDIASSLGKIGRYHKRKKEGVAKWGRPKKAKEYNLSTMHTSGQQTRTEVEDNGSSTITRYFYRDNK